MGDSDDPIKKLLEQTGWSYTEVLKKLEKYKNECPTSESQSVVPSAQEETQGSNNSKVNGVENKNSNNNAENSEDGKHGDNDNVSEIKSTENIKNSADISEDNATFNNFENEINHETFESETENSELSVAVEDNIESSNEYEESKNEVTIKAELIDNYKDCQDENDKYTENSSDLCLTINEKNEDITNTDLKDDEQNNQNLINIEGLNVNRETKKENITEENVGKEIEKNGKNNNVTKCIDDENNKKEETHVDVEKLQNETNTIDVDVKNSENHSLKKLKRGTNSFKNERLRLIHKYKKVLKKGSGSAENMNENIESEDIRNKLKEQLELLRNKRKTTESPLTPDKSSSSGYTPRNKNGLNSVTTNLLQKLNKNVSSETEDESNSELSVQNVVNNEKLSKGVNVLSNESNFTIVNVVGGYKSPTPEAKSDGRFVSMEDNSNSEKENSDISRSSESLSSSSSSEVLITSAIKPRKTNDVTKIKGWKNKKFSLNKGKQKPSDRLLQLLTSDSEGSSHSASTNVDKEPSTKKSTSLVPESVENNNATESAFVSDALDHYLTENSQLNISYEVPKLEAEQTIRKTYIDIKFPEFPQESRKTYAVKNNGNKVNKPKTLAEKRKMLIESQAPQIKDFMVNMSTKQRKDYEATVLNMRNKLIEENVPFTRRCFVASSSITNTSSFVVYNGRRYRVPYSKSKEIVVEINEKITTFRGAPAVAIRSKRFKELIRKPSLLKSLKTYVKRTVFNPDEWESVDVKLPKLSLEVNPKIGKRIDPKLEHLIKYDEEAIITEDRINFALSVLKSENSTLDCGKFTFPVNYANNQESVKMLRRIPVITDVAEDVKPVVSETDAEINESVNSVINKLLDYVETLEDTKDIIKEEDNEESLNSSFSSDQADNNSGTNDKEKRKSQLRGPKSVRKTTLEMKRLNCKIVSISLDEENVENKPCEKESCKLGCICKSIECNSANSLRNHCRLLKCMFKCSCNYKKDVNQKISLSSGTDIFSEGVINRLRDEAKKNLAKEEKEFTQTIIRANNQIIIVEDSRDRRRRATKMPKKYDDYVEEDLVDRVASKYLSTKKSYLVPPNYKDSVTVKPCSIELLKHDFSDIIPFCMVHMLYKCHCRNKAVFDSGAEDANIIGCKVMCPTKPASPLRPGTVMKNQMRSRSNKTFNKELYCSRTRGLSTSYYILRNKSDSHKNIIVRSSRKLQRSLEAYLQQNADKIMQDGTTDTLSALYSSRIMAEPSPRDNVKQKSKKSVILCETNEITNSSIVSDSDPNLSPQNASGLGKEPKLQRRKIKINTKQNGQETANVSKENEHSAVKEVTTNTNKSKKFFALLNKKNNHLRLLPWSTLATRFENGSFQLWFSNSSKANQLIITENSRRPGTNYYNIRLFEQSSKNPIVPADIIRWLITKTVPHGKSADQILLVLAFNKDHWKIFGVCEKTRSDSNPKGIESISLTLIEAYCSVDDSTDEEVPVIDIDANGTNENVSDVVITDTNSEKAEEEEEGEEEEGQTETLIHENLQENKKVMYCSRRRFQPKKLINDDALKIRQVLWAPIPSVTLACKWRVICMNVGFAFLSLSRSSYTIKYDDIMKAVRLAQAEKTTIILKSEELQKNYPHRNFGIYCVHNYADKIFIGPYFLNENHDLDTLSFVNSVLVNTNLFNQIKGKTVPGSGFWFHQVTNLEDKNIDDDVTIIQETPALIDLTCDSDEESSDEQTSTPQKVVEDSSLKESTLLERMLTPLPDDEEDEETLKAEKALDTLLKTGQLNVNKTTVPNSFTNLKSLLMSSKSQIPTISIVNTSSPNKSENQSNSNGDDDDKLVIDEDYGPKQKDEKSNKQLEDDSNLTDIKCRYLITNVPNLGYIVAYYYDNSVDVVCPITQKTKSFPDNDAAITAVERVLSKRFIIVPSTFKLKITMLESIDDSLAPLDRTVLNGYHMVGNFGVKNIAHSSPKELTEFGLNKSQIGYVLLQREQKVLVAPMTELAKLLNMSVNSVPLLKSLSEILLKTLSEMDTLQKDKVTYTNEKIDLETKKITLVEKCSKLIAALPSDQKSKAQQELDRIINFSAKENADTASKPPTSTCIEVLDDADEKSTTAENSQVPSQPPKSPLPISLPIPPPKIKITRPTLSNTSCSIIPPRSVEVVGNPNPRSLLNGNIRINSTNKNKPPRKIIIKQKNLTGKSVVNSIDLNNCAYQIKPLNTNTTEKVLLKDLPIMVRKNLKAMTQQSIIKPVITTTAVKSVATTTPVNPSKTVIGTVPSTVTKVTKIPTIGSMLTAIAHNRNAVKTVTTPSLGSISIPKSKLLNIMSSQSAPYTCVPVPIAPKPTKSNTMATITQVPKAVVASNIIPKNTVTSPNYIAIKDGDNMKYFQLVSETKLPSLKPIQGIKRPSSNSTVEPPTKKIPRGTSLLMNQKDKTDK